MLPHFGLKIGGRDSQSVPIFPKGVREGDDTYSDMKNTFLDQNKKKIVRRFIIAWLGIY